MSNNYEEIFKNIREYLKHNNIDDTVDNIRLYFDRWYDELLDYSNAELVDLYKYFTDSKIKKFRDKVSGILRIMSEVSLIDFVNRDIMYLNGINTINFVDIPNIYGSKKIEDKKQLSDENIIDFFIGTEYPICLRDICLNKKDEENIYDFINDTDRLYAEQRDIFKSGNYWKPKIQVYILYLE